MQKSKKYLIGIYILFLILCISGSVYQGLQLNINYLSDAYGLSKDESVKLDEKSEISCIFHASHENMQGVSVKFMSEKRFSGERMIASLYDDGSGEKLAEKSVFLEFERIQNKDGGSSIFFTLPAENVKGKILRLVFTLKDQGSDGFPSLVLSESSANESTLLVNDKQTDMNLVFSVIYSGGFSRNISDAIANGLLWVFIGTVLFLFMLLKCNEIQRKNRNTDAENNSEKEQESIISQNKKSLSNYLNSRYLLAGIAFMTVFLGILFLYVYKYAVDDVIESGRFWYFRRMYMILCFLLFAGSIVSFTVCFIKKWNAEKIFIALVIPFGVIFSLVITLNTVPDEPSHIDTAYSLSNEILGVPKSDKPGYIYKRAEDFDAYAEEKQKLNKKSYRELYEGLFRMAENEELVECSARSNLGNAGRIYYLPQAIGITIGRLFHLGMMPTMMLGRLMGLFVYAILVFYAIRKLPIAKYTLLLISLLPISLQQAASFSYDGIINGVSFLYIAYCLYAVYNEKELSFAEAAIIAVAGSMVCAVKGGVYVALCFVPLLALFHKRSGVRKQYWVYWAFSGIGLFAFAGKNLIRTLARFMAVAGSVTGGAASTQVYTFSDIIHDPIRFIGMFLNTFYEQGDKYIRNLFGGNLAWRDINISWIIMFGYVFVILLSCIQNEGEKKIAVLDRWYLGLTALVAFGCVEVSMLLVWTPVTYDYITGVQGRYFIPFFLLILIACRNSFFQVRRNIEKYLVFAMTMLNIITILQVVQRALER